MNRVKHGTSEGIMSKKPKYKIDNSKLTRMVEKAKRGNQKALDEVVNMISGYIYYYSLTILGDEEQAKDAVQDILLTMLKKIDSLEDPKAFLGWIKTVSSNHCKTKLTRSKDNISLDDGTWELADCSDQICPSKAAETKEVCALVREAVTALPQLLRESVMMFYFNQMSVRQIADILEVNESTVKSRLYSARKTMKKYLEQYGGSALASCAIPPMSLLSFSLIEGAEQQQGILIPYVAKSGEVKLASVNPAPAATAASTIPIKAVIAGAACLAIAGVVGTAANLGSSGGGSTDPVQATTYAESKYSEQKPTVSQQIESEVEAHTTISVPKNPKTTEPKIKITEPTKKENPTAAANVPNAPRTTEKPTPAVTEPTEPEEKITATFNITVNKKDFSNSNQKFFCEIYDESNGYLVIRRAPLKQVGSSDTWRFDFDEQYEKVVMYAGRKYSITFYDNTGAAAAPLTIDSFDISKEYKAVSTGRYIHDDITGENYPLYKWT